MAKLTLLDMVQDILTSMESDKVNNISDTEEALSVASTIKETYFDLIANRDWPFLKARQTLTAFGDTANPTKMQFPDTVDKVYWLKYNKKDVTYIDAKEFQDILDSRTVTTGVVDAAGFIINADPLYWTSFDDNLIYFDGYDSATESSLQASKSKAYVLTIPTWTVSNTFIPTLPEKMFPFLLADSKSTCFLNYKQTANPKEERKAQRLRVRMQNEARRNNKAESTHDSDVNYGRSPASSARNRPRGT